MASSFFCPVHARTIRTNDTARVMTRLRRALRGIFPSFIGSISVECLDRRTASDRFPYGAETTGPALPPAPWINLTLGVGLALFGGLCRFGRLSLCRGGVWLGRGFRGLSCRLGVRFGREFCVRLRCEFRRRLGCEFC